MPELKLTDDPALYNVETPKGVVKINALELSSAVVAAGGTEKETTPDHLRTAVRAVATPKEIVESLDENQLFAIGARVATHFEAAGKGSAS